MPTQYVKSKEISKASKDEKRSKIMSDDEMKMIDDMLTKISNNKGNMGSIYRQWTKEQEAYEAEQAIIPERPNTRVNIVNSNIEGQLAALVEQNIAIMARGQSAGDEKFAEWARIGVEWTFKKNKFKQIMQVHERRRLLFGCGILKVSWNADAINGFGIAKIAPPPINKMFIDTKIKDLLKFQEAEYIAETLQMSERQVKKMYGEEKSEAVDYGNIQIENTNVFSEEDTIDDDNSITVIQWWERNEDMLRLIEFSGDGVLLYDSHKTGERDNQDADSEMNPEPYYENVDNKYPYFMTGMYPIEGQLWGFGDGKLLLPLQSMINEFYDKIRIASKPNMVFYDPDSQVDLDGVNDNSYDPIPCRDPNKNVRSVEWGQVNNSWWQMLEAIHAEVQRVTRFSNLMLGQQASTSTATEAAIQQQQGSAATNNKKNILQETLSEMAGYIVALMMEYYTEAKAFRITDEKDDYTWIDFRQLKEVPSLIPATDGFIKRFRKNPNNVDKETPKWEVLKDSEGNDLTKNVDLDLDITIGAGLPSNKSFLWQMTQQLSTLEIEGQSAIHYEEFRYILKELFGLPLMEMDDIIKQRQAEQQKITESGGVQLPNANVQGLTTQLPPTGGGVNGNNR